MKITIGTLASYAILVVLLLPAAAVGQSAIATNSTAVGQWQFAKGQHLLSRHMAQIQQAFRDIDHSSLQEVRIEDDEITVSAVMGNEDQDKLPEVLRELAMITSLKITHVSATKQENAVAIEIRCDLGSSKDESKQTPQHKMDIVMEELFPAENLQIMELPNAVVLRGQASEGAIPKIITIAEQFYPTVINHLELRTKAEQPKLLKPHPESVKDQLSQLRGEVRSLHQDVKKLIDMLESEQRREAAGNNQLQQQTDSASNGPSLENRQPWNLSLLEVVSITESNGQAQQSEKLQQRVDAARKNFYQLQEFQNQFAAQKSQLTPSVDELDYFQQAGLQFQLPAGARRQRAPLHQLQSQIQETERRLRDAMGLQAIDGRLITPTDE